MKPIPELPKDRVHRSFCIQDINVEVTSLDVASHGCFIVAGCSNGVILLFDLSDSSEQYGGRLIGHIRAKGLHTNLLLTVKFSEDSRFCFAGVMKGSSEMLAIDLGKLKVDWKMSLPLKAKNGCGAEMLTNDYKFQQITTFSHADPKLRGFGAVARVCDGGSDSIGNYRLACGRGIKNVHVWLFRPPTQGDGSISSQAQWSCIYDVASNGNTITSVGFRRGGMELLSKSAGVNMRVWNIDQSHDMLLGGGAKPNYDDVANSQDVKCMMPSGFAFGGTYEFTEVMMDAAKEVNRDAFEIPERNLGLAGILASEEDIYSAGLRRRRYVLGNCCR